MGIKSERRRGERKQLTLSGSIEQPHVFIRLSREREIDQFPSRDQDQSRNKISQTLLERSCLKL